MNKWNLKKKRKRKNKKIKRLRFDCAKILKKIFRQYCCVNISTSPFHLDLPGKRHKAYLAKIFILLSIAHVFRIAQKLQIPKLQCHCGHRVNIECRIVSSITIFKGSMFTFIIIRPITKFGFRFFNIGNFDTNFTF